MQAASEQPAGQQGTPSAQTRPHYLGKYRIDGILGEGAMGVVYRGFDPELERPVAVKTIRKELLDGPNGREVFERFKREANAGLRLSHRHVVSVYEYGEDNNVAYIAMEFIAGKTLHALNKERPHWPLLDALDLAHQLLVALDFFHERGVVHRDIKPANIMIDDAKNLVVTDFGLARTEASELTQVGTVLGTPSYMSPEQISGLPVDGRADLFAVGVILYEMLTGRKPFSGSAITVAHGIVCEPHPDPSSQNSTLPAAIDILFHRALAKRPEDRFQNGAEFREALRRMVHAILHGDDEAPRSIDATRIEPARAATPPSAAKPPQTSPAMPPHAGTARPEVTTRAAPASSGSNPQNLYRSCPNCKLEFSEPRPWNAICSGCGLALSDAAQQARRPPATGFPTWMIVVVAIIVVFIVTITLFKR